MSLLVNQTRVMQMDLCNHMNYNGSIWPMHLNHFSNVVVNVLVFKKNSKNQYCLLLFVFFVTFSTVRIVYVKKSVCRFEELYHNPT